MTEFGFLRVDSLGVGVRSGGRELCLDAWGTGASRLTGEGGEPDASLALKVSCVGPGGEEKPVGADALRALPADEGPERAAVRLPLSLSAGETYCGDALQEVTVLPGGVVLMGLGMRLIAESGIGALRSAGVGLHVSREPFELLGASGAADGKLRAFADAGDFEVLRVGNRFLGVYWGRDLKGWCDPLGGGGLWDRIGDGKTAPFFHGWENHLRQWSEPRGWRARETGGLLLEGDSLTLAWHHGSDLPLEGATHFSGAVALSWGQSEDEVRAKMEALASPLVPEAGGARVTGFDYLEGSYRFRRAGRNAKVTLPADPLARRALVRVDGPPAAAVSCSVNGESARPQLVSVGRVDDPYGPHEGRPDSNGRPVLARFEKPAERVEVGVALSKDAPTVLEVAESQGVSLSYLGQDDRRELLLFSHLDEGPLGRLSLADLKLRDLRLPGAPRVAAAIVPLYWFMMNAPSRYHSANLLESWEVLSNGPEELRFSLSALNPGGRVRSTFDVSIPAPEPGSLRMDVRAKLEVLGEFNVPHFQFCNLFPEPSRMPEDWGHAETLAASGDRLWIVENRKPTGGASTAGGKRFKECGAPFFLSQYACVGGNFAILVSSVDPGDTQLAYELCRCWLDDHMYVVFPEGGPAVGSRLEVRYQLALWGDGSVARDRVRELAAASLASGRLEV